MQTFVERLKLPTEMSMRSSVLLDVAVALVRTQKLSCWPVFIISLLVCAFGLQTARGHAFAIFAYACAARSLTLGPCVLHGAPLYLPCHRHRCLILRFLLNTPHFDHPISSFTIPSPGEVPRALLGESVEAMGHVRHVDRKIPRDFTEVA